MGLECDEEQRHPALRWRAESFQILHVADHGDVSAQAERLEAVSEGGGIPVKRFAAKETNHSKLNENLGLPEDPSTKVLFEFVDEALK